jgi:hypothetical protein
VPTYNEKQEPKIYKKRKNSSETTAGKKGKFQPVVKQEIKQEPEMWM